MFVYHVLMTINSFRFCLICVCPCSISLLCNFLVSHRRLEWIYTLRLLSDCLLDWNRCNIRRLSNCSRTRTHNHLVHKWTLNNLAKLAKWFSCVVNTYLYGVLTVFIMLHMQLEWIYALKLPECQETPSSKQAKYWVLLESLNLQMFHLFQARRSLTFRQTQECRFTLNT